MHRIAISLCVGLAAALATVLPARAIEPPSVALPDDMDALSLADKAPSPTPPPVQVWRVFVEAAGGQGWLRGSDAQVGTTRASLDARFDAALHSG